VSGEGLAAAEVLCWVVCGLGVWLVGAIAYEAVKWVLRDYEERES
jgi:hypothetical protein